MRLVVDEGDSGPMAARGDRRWLRNAVDNLLTNAVRALAARVADGERWVHLACKHEGKRIGIVIEDNGPGLPEAVALAFSEGLPVQSSHGGWGVGLATVWWALHSMGGSATYRPREGGGSRFELVLRGKADA